MMAAHLLPVDVLVITVGSGLDASSERIVDGRSSILFAVVAGVALGLVTGGSAPPRERRWPARGRLVVRALLLIALGTLLWMLPSGIAIILDYYGVMFLLLVPLLFLRRRWLSTAAVVILIAATLARDAALSAGVVDEPAATLLDYALLGYYPALLWLPLLLAGLVLARSGLGSTRTRLIALALGTLSAVAGYGAAVVVPGQSAAAHSSTVPELLGSGGLAVAIIALLVMLLDAGDRSRLARLLLAPLSAIGRVPLTVYTVHVVVIALLAPLGPAGFFEPQVGLALWLTFSIGGAALGLVLGRLGWRGPLEAALSTISGLPFRARSVRDERTTRDDSEAPGRPGAVQD